MEAREQQSRSVIKSLKDVYYILSTGEPYKEFGAEAAQNRKSDARKCSIIRELGGIGYSVRKTEASA